MKTHIYMKPTLKSIKDALNLKPLCFLKYIIEFIINNILLPAKQIVNCLLSIVNYQLFTHSQRSIA